MRRTFRIGLLLSAAAALSSLAQADEPIVVIDGDITEELREIMRPVLGDVSAPARSIAQARRRVEAAAPKARDVLRSQGYYDGRIDARLIETIREANNLDADLSDDAEDGLVAPPQALLTVTTGPQYTYGNISVVFKGAEPDVAAAARAELRLENGAPALAAPVVAAELRVVNYLQTQGYPEATLVTRQPVVDHATRTLNVTYTVDAGRKTRFGEIKQSGTAKLSRKWPQMVAPFEPGEIFDIRDMNRLPARINGSGVFDGAVATLADEVTENADGTITRDVLLDVEQGDVNTISGELGYSTTDGSGVDIVYERRNFIGYAQTLRLSATAKTNELGVGARYNIPYAWRVDRELDLSARVEALDTEAFKGERVQLNGLMTQKISSVFRVGLGLGLEASRFEENGVDVTAYLVEGLGRAIYDNRDSVLNPTRGYFAEAVLTPTYNFGEADGIYTAARLTGTHYQKLSEQIVLAGRASAGTIITGDFDTVPINRRYFAGGGGSVRGFGYQTISPLDANADETGGRSILELAGEVRYRLKDSPFGVVGFVDAASVDRSATLGFDDIRYGAGVGVRYHTAFAPMRADIAIPLNPRDGDAGIQIYISIGQAF